MHPLGVEAETKAPLALGLDEQFIICLVELADVLDALVCKLHDVGYRHTLIEEVDVASFAGGFEEDDRAFLFESSGQFQYGRGYSVEEGMFQTIYKDNG